MVTEAGRPRQGQKRHCSIDSCHGRAAPGRRGVLEARRLLESSDLPVEDVAWRCDFGTAASLREHFRRATATTPTAYRRSFRVSA